MKRFTTIGTSSPALHGREIVTGKARYTADLDESGALVGRLLYAPAPSGRIRKIDTARARALPGVKAVLTSRDIPGENSYQYEDTDQPLLVGDFFRYQGDALAAVAAVDEATAQAALEAIRVEYDPLPGIFDARAAMQPGSPRVWPERENIYKRVVIECGDLLAGFAQADVILENEYVTPYQEHAFLEPECALASPQPGGGMLVYSCTQNPYSDRRQIARSLALPDEQVRVVLPFIGGAFGGKDEAHVQIHAALLAQATGQAVKMRRTREESIRVHVKRHPFTIRYRSGITSDGRLVAIWVEGFADTGPYANAAGSAVTIAANCISGAYAVANAHIDLAAVNTNNPISGAMRGFGMPQAHFACECQMDALAAAIGMDPLKIRRLNGLESGMRLVTGARLLDGRGMKATLEEAARLSGWEQRANVERKPAPALRRGWGLATSLVSYLYPHGFKDDAGVEVEVNPDGTVTVHSGAVDFGQGIHSALAHFVAEGMGVALASIQVHATDTGEGIDAGSSVAARQTYISGNAVLQASGKLKAKLLELAEGMTGIPAGVLDLRDGCVTAEGEKINLCMADLAARAQETGQTLTTRGYYRVKFAEGTFDEHAYPEANGVFTFCTQVARVLVDVETGEVKVEQLFAVTDAGQVIHLDGAREQIEGGMSMGFGQAVMEELLVNEGRTLTNSLDLYLIPTAMDVPAIQSRFVEIPQAEGPYGAKGVGEAGVVPTAAAIHNAVADAIGTPLRRIPLTAEVVLEALKHYQEKLK